MSPFIPLSPGFPPGRAALVVGHPGHELRIHGWLELAQPIVFVLTDGSGHGNRSRLASSTRVIDGAGGRTGSIYGRFTDVEIYAALLRADVAVFTRVVEELAAALRRDEVAYVLSDAAEGYNPTHDICRHIVDAAVQIVRRTAPLESFEFAVLGPPGPVDDNRHPGSVCVNLDAAAFERKLQAAREYPEMTTEVDTALRTWGEDAFRLECFRAIADQDFWREPSELPPYYERHGERRLTEGTYAQVIRYRDHVRPLRDALLGAAAGRP